MGVTLRQPHLEWILVYPLANGANERRKIWVVSRGGNFFIAVENLTIYC